MASSQTMAPAQRAFLVQLAPSDTDEGCNVVGRIEHIRSGDVGHFASVDELVGFMRRALGEGLSCDANADRSKEK